MSASSLFARRWALRAAPWLALRAGAFAQQKRLAVEAIQFVSRLEANQALVGGGLDLVTTGAVIANFPARDTTAHFFLHRASLRWRRLGSRSTMSSARARPKRSSRSTSVKRGLDHSQRLVGAFKHPPPAAQYFDPSLFLDIAAEA